MEENDEILIYNIAEIYEIIKVNPPKKISRWQQLAYQKNL
jgi:hypothetical protein